MNKETILYPEHLKLNAKMVDFAGWQMPVQYHSVKDECIAVRHHCGIFDVSHMGEFLVEGKDAVAFVDFIMTNDFLTAPIGKAVYSPLCNHDGMILDDFIAYKLTSTKVLLCVNASNIDKDYQWIEQHVNAFSVKFSNLSDHYSLIAVQGPKSEAILSQAIATDLSQLAYYAVKELDNDLIVARTGYTGEDGFEVFIPNQATLEYWIKLLKAGAKPCGLAARDVLRLEVCFPLYGNDLTEKLTPLDVGLKWTVKLNKNNFIGKQALVDHRPKFKLIKLSLEKGIPRAGYEVWQDERIVGEVTSGGVSVSLEQGIALALVKLETKNEQPIQIKIRNNFFNATIHTKAFIN
jgi:aminomethyltransferase